MKIEIWSDIMCPFCYIGKRHFEAALKQFDQSKQITVEWKSFQLDPTIPMPYTEDKDMYAYLADRKGISMEQSRQMHQNVTRMAADAGLNYDFDKVRVANSWNAHRIIQLAKSYQLDDAVEERFFKAYFTEGADMANPEVLTQLASEAGLDTEEVKLVLQSDEFANEVRADILQAQTLGINGVPFFVFNHKFGLSGAQPVEAFLQTLQHAYSDWQKENETTTVTAMSQGPSCDVQGNCNES